jgi:hypothetical protein
MMKRNVGAMLVGLLSASVAAAASCSFPTYNITLPTGTGTGGESGSSGSVGGGGSSSATSTGSTSSATSSTATSSSAASSSSTGGFDAGACPVDEDNDTVISWQCPGGNDCADQDDRAHPGAGFQAGPAIKGTRSPNTLPYDFDCDLKEMKETLTLTCPTTCVVDVGLGFKEDEDCGASSALGHCGNDSILGCKWISNSTNTIERCK